MKITDWRRSSTKIIPRRLLLVIARLLFCLFVVMTSSYCLLAYIPFTYRWVINGTLVMWLPAFARCHTAIYWVALIGVLPTLRGGGSRAARALVAGFVIL